MKPKNISLEQYKQKYCIDQRIRGRKQLYVSPEVHKTVNDVVFLLKYSHVTAASLIDTILKEHFTNHKEIINAEAKRQRDEFLSWSSSRNSDE